MSRYLRPPYDRGLQDGLIGVDNTLSYAESEQTAYKRGLQDSAMLVIAAVAKLPTQRVRRA